MRLALTATPFGSTTPRCSLKIMSAPNSRSGRAAGAGRNSPQATAAAIPAPSTAAVSPRSCEGKVDTLGSSRLGTEPPEGGGRASAGGMLAQRRDQFAPPASSTAMRLEAITVKTDSGLLHRVPPVTSASRRFAVPADCFASLEVVRTWSARPETLPSASGRLCDSSALLPPAPVAGAARTTSVSPASRTGTQGSNRCPPAPIGVPRATTHAVRGIGGDPTGQAPRSATAFGP